MRHFARLCVTATLWVTLLGLTSTKHEFYVSITELNVRNDTLQIAIKVFTDDLEHTLKEVTGNAVFLDNNSDHDRVFRTIRDYCDQKVDISNAAKAYALTWIGHEYIEDVTWVYAYTILDSDSKMLFVRNTLLGDQFHDQHNMIYLRQGETVLSKLCTKSRPEVRFVLE